MKVVIFGGTGRIGKHAVDAALQRGYEVRLFTRNAKKVTVAHPNLTVIDGQTSDVRAVGDAIDGVDAVVNVLAVPTKRSYARLDALEAHRNIISGMRAHGVTRFVGWSTPIIRFPDDAFNLVYAVGRRVAGVIWQQGKLEMEAIAKLVVESKLDWTLIRFFKPIDAAPIASVKAETGKTTSDRRIPRASIGAFMIDQVENRRFLHEAPIIGS